MIGIVLAGGWSTRFGDTNTNKAVAILGTGTLLKYVMDTVKTVTNQPSVVAIRTSPQQATYMDVTANVVFTFDASEFEGPVAGVIGALESVNTQWMFVCGCDMSLLSAAAIDWLKSRMQTLTDGCRSAALAIPHPDGTVDPMHALYRRSAIHTIQDSLQRNGGVRSLLATVGRVKTVPITTAPQVVLLE